MRKNRTQRGLSLLEMSAASMVVAVALLGTTAAVVSGASLSAEVTRMRAASRVATSVMEDVRATEFADLVGTFDDTKLSIDCEEEGIADAVAAVSVALVDNGSTSHLVYEVTIDVSFEGATGAQSYPIVTYVCDRVAGNSMSTPTEVPSDDQAGTGTDTTTDPGTTGGN